MARLTRIAQAHVALIETSVRLSESLIKLADALTLRIENTDCIESIIDVEQMSLAEALDVLHRCVKAMKILERR